MPFVGQVAKNTLDTEIISSYQDGMVERIRASANKSIQTLLGYYNNRMMIPEMTPILPYRSIDSSFTFIKDENDEKIEMHHVYIRIAVIEMLGKEERSVTKKIFKFNMNNIFEEMIAHPEVKKVFAVLGVEPTKDFVLSAAEQLDQYASAWLEWLFILFYLKTEPNTVMVKDGGLTPFSLPLPMVRLIETFKKNRVMIGYRKNSKYLRIEDPFVAVLPQLLHQDKTETSFIFELPKSWLSEIGYQISSNHNVGSIFVYKVNPVPGELCTGSCVLDYHGEPKFFMTAIAGLHFYKHSAYGGSNTLINRAHEECVISNKQIQFLVEEEKNYIRAITKEVVLNNIGEKNGTAERK